MPAIIFLLINFALLSASPMAFAQAQDHQQALNIEADQLRIDEKNGRSTYSGHVKISRGSLLIKGDKVVLQSDNNNALKYVRVEGMPASFKQLNEQQQLISAQAQELVYRNISGILTLKKDAVLVQNKNTFRAEKIIYNTRTDVVQAGQNDGSATSKNERVFITIHPNDADTTNTP